MPIYEYKCLDCNNKFSELQSIHDEPLCICLNCNGVLKKLISCSSIEAEYKNSKEYYEKVIKKDVKEAVDKIKNGDENALADILGEG